MTNISIYDYDGNQIDDLSINDTLERPLRGRVSKGEKFYYKGLGVYYSQHHIDKRLFDEDLYTFVRKSDIFYLGYVVKRKAFESKFGIFQEPFQPMFTDFIGTCGVKELSIIENSMFFEKSSAEVVKSIRYDTMNNQYYFIMNYSCGRRRYIDEGDPKLLRELIDYTLATNWNFIWDKDSITDISYNGLVTDVGELFVSDTLINKFGSVYSVIYSLAKRNFDKYIEFCNVNDLEHIDDRSYVFNTLELLLRNGVDIKSMLPYDDKNQNYKHIILEYLVTGRNCGHCSFVDVGENIKSKYISDTKSAFGVF